MYVCIMTVYYLTRKWISFIYAVDCCIETENEWESEIPVQVLKVKPKPSIE